MTGWEKVGAATLLAIVGLVGLNLAIWRRLKTVRLAAKVKNYGQRDIQA